MRDEKSLIFLDLTATVLKTYRTSQAKLTGNFDFCRNGPDLQLFRSSSFGDTWRVQHAGSYFPQEFLPFTFVCPSVWLMIPGFKLCLSQCSFEVDVIVNLPNPLQHPGCSSQGSLIALTSASALSETKRP